MKVFGSTPVGHSWMLGGRRMSVQGGTCVGNLVIDQCSVLWSELILDYPRLPVCPEMVLDGFPVANLCGYGCLLLCHILRRVQLETSELCERPVSCLTLGS